MVFINQKYNTEHSNYALFAHLFPEAPHSEEIKPYASYFIQTYSELKEPLYSQNYNLCCHL